MSARDTDRTEPPGRAGGRRRSPRAWLEELWGSPEWAVFDVGAVVRIMDAEFRDVLSEAEEAAGKETPSFEREFSCGVPLAVRLHRPEPGRDALEVGAVSAGSLDVALNILNFFVPPEADGREMVRCRVNYASATAHELHERFCRQFLGPMDPTGGDIPHRGVRRWILAQLARQSP